MIDGRLSLTTPEGTRLLLTPAGPAPRAWAWALDTALWLGFMLAASWLLSGSRMGQGVLAVLAFLSYWGYPVLCEVYWQGQTVGKRALGLQVRRDNGLPVGWRESALRNLLLAADFLPLAYCTGLVCMLYDHQFRRLGDIVAGTLVVYRERAPAHPAAAQVATHEAAPLPLPFPLSSAQQRALADLFEREAGLPQARLAELGDLATSLTGTTGAASLERLRSYAAGLKR